MRRMHVLALVLLAAAGAEAQVGTTVYLSEPNLILEPIEVTDASIVYGDIMVGTKLAIVIDSNEAIRWSGELFIEEPYLEYGVLTGRDYNDVTYDYEGSRLAEAGERARVFKEENVGLLGFSFYNHWVTGVNDALPGKWFVIDYTATQPGPCVVRFYRYVPNLPEPPDESLIHEIVFNNVPSRDFDGSRQVDSGDYAHLAACWMQLAETDESPCFDVDINADKHIDFADLILFGDYWLERTRF